MMHRFTRNVPRKRPTGPYINKIAGFKWCPHCRSHLVVDAFGLDQSRDDGLSGWCRKCRARGEKARRDADLGMTRAALRSRYRADPDRHKSHVAVARALVKGILRKPRVCPVCLKIRRIEAHHFKGYAREHWLDVVWRCRQCHAIEHKRGAAEVREEVA